MIDQIIRAITQTPNLSDPRVMIYEGESYTVINSDDPDQIPPIPPTAAKTKRLGNIRRLWAFVNTGEMPPEILSEDEIPF